MKMRGIVAAVLLAVLLGTADAGLIGINWGVDANQYLAPSEVAGAPGFTQANWNNFTGTSQGTPQALLNDAGTPSGATLTWGGSPNMYQVGGGTLPATPNAKLMKGYLDTNASSTTTINLANIPYGTYDVVVYFDGDSAAGRSGTYTVQAGALTVTKSPLIDTANWPMGGGGTFVEADSGQSGNYAVFTGFTASSATITATPVNFRAPINGIQIFEAGPPPIPHGRVEVGPGNVVVGAAYALTDPGGLLAPDPTVWTLEHADSFGGPRTVVSQGTTRLGDQVLSEPFLALPPDLDEGFESGDIGLSPWTQVVVGSNQEFRITNSFGTGPQAGAFQMGQSNWGARDNAPDLIQARSAEFVLGPGDLTFYMQGGAANGNIIPTGLVTLNPNATGSGYLGAALRDATTGEFLLTDSRTSNSHTWQQGGWTAAELLPYLGSTLTIDLIDNFAGGWGFIAFDSFVIPQQDAPLAAQNGYYFLTVNGESVFTGVLIPEPASVALLALGALALRRRKR